jgi:DNA-binding MarR family transcriptional regulator
VWVDRLPAGVESRRRPERWTFEPRSSGKIDKNLSLYVNSWTSAVDKRALALSNGTVGTPHSPRAELSTLFRETVSLYHRLTANAADIHGLGPLSGPRRTVLLALADSGPQTVARLARARAQTRQRLQPLINALMSGGLVKAVPNPQHKQSPIVQLTRKGARHVRAIVETEGALLTKLSVPPSPQQLLRAAAVLRHVRESLETQMPALLGDRPRRRRRLPRLG